MRALIIESGMARAALAAARALSSAGWSVGVGTPDGGGMTAASRTCAAAHVVPSAHADPEGFVRAINAATASHGYEVVFVTGDAEALLLSAERASIDAVVPFPDHETLVRSYDKWDLTQACLRVGLPVPTTLLAADSPIDALDFPVVVKPRLHWTPGRPGAPARHEAAIAPNEREATRLVRAIESAGQQALLQEVVRGRPVNYHLVADRQGALLTSVLQLSEPLLWPPGAGIRTRSHTAAVPDDLRAKVGALMRDLGWHGLAGLNFIEAPGREPLLTDFNGRLLASIALSISAGVNLPALWAAQATGRPLPPPVEARVGVAFQWLDGDLRRALREGRGGVPADVLGTLRYATRASHTTWDPKDLRPSAFLAARRVREASRHLPGLRPRRAAS